MCKAWSDAQRDAARNAAILATIKTARRYGATDEAILADIMEQFDLTEAEAKNYMVDKIA